MKNTGSLPSTNWVSTVALTHSISGKVITVWINQPVGDIPLGSSQLLSGSAIIPSTAEDGNYDAIAQIVDITPGTGKKLAEKILPNEVTIEIPIASASIISFTVS